VRHGIGRGFLNNGEMYEGTWKYGRAIGYGRIIDGNKQTLYYG
jgi:hypothetical protein